MRDADTSQVSRYLHIHTYVKEKTTYDWGDTGESLLYKITRTQDVLQNKDGVDYRGVLSSHR